MTQKKIHQSEMESLDDVSYIRERILLFVTGFFLFSLSFVIILLFLFLSTLGDTFLALADDSDGVVAGVENTREADPYTPLGENDLGYTDERVYYAVVDVTDGDTIKVDVRGTIETVRLIGIDTPEVENPEIPVQCYGPEASSETKELLLGRSVRLEMDPTHANRDKYERLLRYVYLPDGTNVAEQLIEKGYGKAFLYNNEPHVLQQWFSELEERAKTAGRGLWDPVKCDGDTTQEASAETIQQYENENSVAGIRHDRTEGQDI